MRYEARINNEKCHNNNYYAGLGCLVRNYVVTYDVMTFNVNDHVAKFSTLWAFFGKICNCNNLKTQHCLRVNY